VSRHDAIAARAFGATRRTRRVHLEIGEAHFFDEQVASHDQKIASRSEREQIQPLAVDRRDRLERLIPVRDHRSGARLHGLHLSRTNRSASIHTRPRTVTGRRSRDRISRQQRRSPIFRAIELVGVSVSSRNRAAARAPFGLQQREHGRFGPHFALFIEKLSFPIRTASRSKKKSVVGHDIH
jgi:hypothetical protein